MSENEVKKITLKDIADKAQVSQSLVSKVLNGKDCRVTNQKRKKIIEIAKKYNYSPKAAGHDRKVYEKGRRILALLQPNLEYGFFCNLTDALCKKAKEVGYDLLIFNTGEDADLERRYLELCKMYQIDGILMSACDNNANIDYIYKLKQEKTPVVFVDRYIYDLDCSFVTSDNYESSYILTEKLINRGHKNILFLYHGEVQFTSVVKARFEGYQAAMIERGLSPIKEIIYSKRPIVHQPIININMFSAIVLSTSTDLPRLIEIIDFMAKDEVKLDIAAFDPFSIPYENTLDNTMFKSINDNLLIMEQDVDAISRSAIDILLKELNQDRSDTKPDHIYIKCKLNEYNV